MQNLINDMKSNTVLHTKGSQEIADEYKHTILSTKRNTGLLFSIKHKKFQAVFKY